MWLQWIHNAAWFPAILSFSGIALAYLIDPELAQNRYFLISVILVGFWGFTFFNYFGLKTSAWFSTIGVMAGTIIPGLLLIFLGIHWMWSGHPMEIAYSADALIPHITGIDDLVFVTGLFLAFGGLEVSAAHAKEVKNPQKTFPRAIIISAVTALVLYVVGALAIAIMIPKEDISVVAGLMEAFNLFFKNLQISWAIYPIGAMIILGAIGELNAWIIGPVRALHATAVHGDLPPILQKINKHGMPANLLVFQAIIVTITSFVFFFMATADGAFWILTAMSAQLYLLMYILMFAAAIKLRYSHGHVKRSYKIPFGLPGIWFVGLVGAISSAFAFIVAFFIPKQIAVANVYFYEGFLIIGIAIMCLIPYMIYKFKAPHWAKHLERK